MSKISKRRNQPITDENMNGVPGHPRLTEIASDVVIDIGIKTVAIASNYGHRRVAERLSDRLLQTVKEEQFIRSVGRAVNLDQVESDIDEALNKSSTQF